MKKKAENRGRKTEVSLRLWLYGLILVAIGSGLATPAQAQTVTPDDAGGASPFVTTVTVTVLDENGDPVAFLPIELHMFKYTESIEAIVVGGCGTDESGSCSIEVVDPPSLGSWMEGMIYIPGLGMEYLGWSENVKIVVIQLLPGNVMATPESFLHFPIEGQDETGTDVPLEMASTAEADGATLTLASTATATETISPLPTETETRTQTPAPTVTEIPIQTPTPSPTTILGRGGSGQNIPIVTVVLVLLCLSILGYWFWRQRRLAKARQKSSKNENSKKDRVE